MGKKTTTPTQLNAEQASAVLDVLNDVETRKGYDRRTKVYTLDADEFAALCRTGSDHVNEDVGIYVNANGMIMSLDHDKFTIRVLSMPEPPDPPEEEEEDSEPDEKPTKKKAKAKKAPAKKAAAKKAPAKKAAAKKDPAKKAKRKPPEQTEKVKQRWTEADRKALVKFMKANKDNPDRFKEFGEKHGRSKMSVEYQWYGPIKKAGMY